MTTEREQLELAAKACGITLDEHLNDRASYRHSYVKWNPLTDDGDCARMEAQLGIDVEWELLAKEVWSSCGNIEIMERFIDYAGDKNAARRAASVAVAAEIGRMK